MEGLEALYDEQRRALGERRGWTLGAKPFSVSFRSYAGLRSVIHDRRTHYEVRLGDLLREAPLDVHASLARLLVGKIDRRLRATRLDTEAYRAWARSPDTLTRHDALRRARGRKRMDPPRGRVHDLDPLFDQLNREYFDGTLAKPRLGWSRSVSRRLYGHQDAAQEAIVINRLLDHPRVPAAVVASILHHEMLHVKHGVRRGPSGRRVVHDHAFKADEHRFAQRDASNRFLRDLEARRIRLRTDPPPRRPARSPQWGILRAWLPKPL